MTKSQVERQRETKTNRESRRSLNQHQPLKVMEGTNIVQQRIVESMEFDDLKRE